MTSPARLAEEIATAVGRLQQLADAAEASGAGDDALLGANRRAVQTHREAVEGWAGKQAEEVLAGTRSYASWHSYGEQLKEDAEYLLRNFQDTAGWFTKVASWAGGWLSSGQQAIAAKVAAIKEDVRQVGELRKVVRERSALLRSRGVPLSPEAEQTLFGPPAQIAEETWSRLTTLLDGLLRVVTSVVTGRAELRDNGQGDVVPVALDGPARMMLGAVQFAVGGVIATVAVCVALVAAARAYYQHANEVVRAELESQEHKLVASGQLSAADLTQLRKLRNEADQSRQPDDLTTTLAKVVGGTVAAGGALWLGWKFLSRAIWGDR